MTTDGALICTECGRRNIPDAVFCATCGRNLAAQRPVSSTSAMPIMPSYDPQPVFPETPPVPPKPPVSAILPTPPLSPPEPIAALAAQSSYQGPVSPTPPLAYAPTPLSSPPDPSTFVVACPRCGHQNEASAIYCEGCGAPVRDPSATPPQPRMRPPSVTAGFGPRLLAYFIDTVIYVVVWFVVLTIVVAVFGEDGTITDVLGIGGIWGVYFVYHWLASVRGRTLGMAIVKLRMVDAETRQRLPSDRAVRRAFMMTLGTTLVGLGLFNVLIDDNNQTWHDRFVDSYVVTS
jgi:uncharacterized RDD family membrane protein YckC